MVAGMIASLPVTSEDRFKQVFDTVEPLIERRYGIPVVISDVPNPFTGDLDGLEIRVDHDLDAEEATFILVHLFGHTVQWNVSERAREIGSAPPTPELVPEIERYEREACRYSLQLFHEAGIRDLDPWLADFSACDLAYLKHFYATGEKRPWRSFWTTGNSLLEPLPIPRFEPRQWRSRWEGVVV
jgi:hypothetical protein